MFVSWKSCAIVAVAVSLAAIGCGTSKDSGASEPPAGSATAVTPTAGDHQLSLVHAGKQRDYLLHAPPGYRAGATLPLVIAMHPIRSTPEAMVNLSGLSAKADEAGFLVSIRRRSAMDSTDCRAAARRTTSGSSTPSSAR